MEEREMKGSKGIKLLVAASMIAISLATPAEAAASHH